MDEKLEFTLSGRLRNIVLAPSTKNCLIPLFEAITNSLHAIEDRFGADELSSGHIEIAVEREKELITGFRVDDNGEGLTPINYKSFITSDSTRKAARGGKGVGRLMWLKVFSHIDLDSYYDDHLQIHRLSFRFQPDDAAPITNKSISLADRGANIGTSIRMEGMRTSFQARSPRKHKTISDEIVRHFISYLVSNNAPTFVLFDGGDRVDVSEYFKENIFLEHSKSINLLINDQLTVEINIHHLLVDKHLRDAEVGFNNVYLNANGRNVESYTIDTPLGMTVLRDNYVYISVVSSSYLDEFVSQERTYLAIEASEKEALKRAVLNAAKEFLAADIGEVRADQRQKAEKVVNSNPRFMTVSGDLDSFMESKIPLSMRDEEEIHLAFEREYRRERNRHAREYLSVRTSANEKVVKEKLEGYVGFLNDDIKFTLAEYVIRRKAVLDAIFDATGHADPEKKRHHLEEVIHDYICPLRTLSDELSYEDHNLWVIDDRLAFYNYFASDKPLRAVQASSSDRREPDLALFDIGVGLRREGSDQPVAVVEFKRPGREDYGGERPVEQLLRYVDSLRSNGSITDKSGRVLSSINEHTSFIGYIIADLTNGFRKTLLGSMVSRRTADGLGLWGFDEPMRTYVEVIPYDKLIRDAKARNEVFFSKLKLQS
jgi:hypothetical protein